MIELLATPSELIDMTEEMVEVSSLPLTNEFLIVLFVCLGIIIGIMLADKFMR